MARGQLRIYLGAAAGVGKTYAMLNEGRRRAEYGEDVVVGYVEPHRRPKTAAQVGDLEVIPRKPVEYRGTTIEEMDVDAVLERRPQVALVDELAHTNAPGSRNEKRWQDVEELLEAGINVISTLNIQHLESLNDVVEEITGVKQRETIPDEVVRRADELQLVDLTPGALRNRLARGDVYPAERIDAALANYFRPGNLSALRELALAWLADRVDEGLEEYRRRHGIEEPWETRERVMVALTGSPDGERLIRRAARMAQRMNGELVAVHVIPQDGLAAPTAKLLERQRELVSELGADYHEVVGEDIGEALLEAARSLNVTQLVMGASRRSRWQRLTRGSVIGNVIRGSGTRIDVHVVSHPDAAEEAFTLPRTRRPATLPRRRLAIGLALAAVGPPALAFLLSHLREQIGLPSVLLLFLLLVIGVSAVGGLVPALVAAISGFLLVNWYFTPPLYTFTISEGENILALVVFLAVAGIVSVFVDLAARRAAQGNRARAEAEALARLAGSALGRRRARRACAVCSGKTAPPSCTARRAAGGSRRRAVTASRRARRQPRRPSTSTPSTCSRSPGKPVRAEDQRILEAFVKELKASVELGELEAEVKAAGVVSAANELRAAILSAVSHDLRTPLAGIKASVTSLLAGRRRLDARGAARVPRHDRGGDRPPERSRRQPPRHEPAADGCARDHAEPRRARRGAPRSVAQPRGRRRHDRARRARDTAARPRRPGPAGACPRQPDRQRGPLLAAREPAARDRRRRGRLRRRPGRRPRPRGAPCGPGSPVRPLPAPRRLGPERGRGARPRGGEGLRRGDGRRDRGRGHPGRRPHDRDPAPGGRVTRILVVDDEPQLLRALGTNLRARGYDVELAPTGEAALTIAARKHPDLVVLDLGLPGMDGTEVIRGLRGWTSVPIIVLSVREREADKVAALDAGADDYVTKPFGMDELLARLRAALRRAAPAEEEAVVETGDFTVDLAAKRVTSSEGEVRLTPTEWHVVEVLVRNAGKLVTQRQLLQEVWGPQYEKETNYLRVYLAQIRRKLEPDPAKPRYFITEARMGYRFEPDGRT